MNTSDTMSALEKMQLRTTKSDMLEGKRMHVLHTSASCVDMHLPTAKQLGPSNFVVLEIGIYTRTALFQAVIAAQAGEGSTVSRLLLCLARTTCSDSCPVATCQLGGAAAPCCSKLACP